MMMRCCYRVCCVGFCSVIVLWRSGGVLSVFCLIRCVFCVFGLFGVMSERMYVLCWFVVRCCCLMWVFVVLRCVLCLVVSVFVWFGGF